MESFGLKQNQESTPERGPFDVEQGLKREKTILGAFRGKAKEIARVMIFMSALTAGSFAHKEAQAAEGETGPRIQSEQMLPKQGLEQSGIWILQSIAKRFDIVKERRDKMHNFLSKLQPGKNENRFHEMMDNARARLFDAYDQITESENGIREIWRQIKIMQSRSEAINQKALEPLTQRILQNIATANNTLDLLEKDMGKAVIESDLYITGPEK